MRCCVAICGFDDSAFEIAELVPDLACMEYGTSAVDQAVGAAIQDQLITAHKGPEEDAYEGWSEDEHGEANGGFLRRQDDHADADAGQERHADKGGHKPWGVVDDQLF